MSAALKRADIVELDVHLFRGRVEVRHAKVLWPTARLWEKWFFLPADTTVPSIESALAVIPPDVSLLLDMKCFTRRAGRRIRRAVPEDRDLIVSCRSWWVLSVFADRQQTIMLRSCGNRLQRFLVKLIPGLGDRVGVVIHERLLEPDTAAALLKHTPHLFSWAAESIERGRELADLGVTGLIVDDLSLDWIEALRQ